METIDFNNLTRYDMVVLGIFLALILRGLWFGALRQITGLIALYGAYFAASQYHQQLLPMLQGISDNPRIVFLTACSISFIATYLAVMLIGRLLRMVVELALVGWFDRFVGGVLGALQATMITVILHMILGAVISPENTAIRNCLTCTALNPATEFARNFIRSPETRASLMQNAPAIERVKERIDAAFDSPTNLQNSEKIPHKKNPLKKKVKEPSQKENSSTQTTK